MQVTWGNSLKKLAETMFSQAIKKKDPFETECTVVGSPVMAGWLKQYFLYDYPSDKKTLKVLACWDFEMLHPFVNDWLAKACTGTPVGQRNPTQHPYSPGVLQWRIWNELLKQDVAEYAILRSYIGDDPKVNDRKRWGLAGKLAQMFDDYQNYRADLLNDWAQKKNTGLPDSQLWQAAMWRNLVNDKPETYLNQFLEMPDKLKSCGIDKFYKRITVFHTSAMPLAYMQFFVEIGKLMPIQMFIFNPSKEFWIEDPSVRDHIKELIKNSDTDTLAWMNPPHPILSGFGRGTQAFLATVLDVTEGNISDGVWSDDNNNDKLLHKIQSDILSDYGVDPDDLASPMNEVVGERRAFAQETSRSCQGTCQNENYLDDGSIQFHACHGPLREVEVVKDLILKWLDENPNAQPRDIQVLAPDMETYAPFIESVFQVNDLNPPIPCSISKRHAVSAGAVGAAFVRLMKFNENRMTASEMVELLELYPVSERYCIAPSELSEIRGLVNSAGIRWGKDGCHLAKMLDDVDAGMPDTVTWRRGLDRLLAGFAVGRCDEGDDVIQAGNLGSLSIFDEVEGNTAELVGKLGQYFEDICKTIESIETKPQRKVSEWTEFYAKMLEQFFRWTESSFIELSEIRRGISAVKQAAGEAGDPEVGTDVMAAAIETHLGGMAPAGKSDINAVLFSPMRTMQVTPRKLIIMLGLNEGVFPRADQRAAFDLLAAKPRYGDRSLRHEDRLAFLEAIMSAREQLIITYTGRNISNNKEVPPSPAVTEFLQYLDSLSTKDKDNPERLLVVPVEHKLHGFSPEYYKKDNALFSYSQSNYEAACVLNSEKTEKRNDDSQEDDQESVEKMLDDKSQDADSQTVADSEITLENLQEFFVNPAKYFYTKVLKIRMPDPARDNLSDSEMFDGNKLDDYNVNQIMVQDILSQSGSKEAGFEPDESYYQRLQEQSLIPLGMYGLGETRQRFSDLKRFLNETGGPANDKDLCQALRDLHEKEKNPIAIQVKCGNYTVTGSLPIIEHESHPFLLKFRYASIKPKDRVRAWVAHVIGHAAEKEFYTDIIGKGDNNKITIVPLKACTAMEILQKMLDLYEKGNSKTLPFAPDCSDAYVNSILKGKDDASARDDAYKAWDAYPFPEHGDPYLFDAWKEDGPMVHEDFAGIAENFWKEFVIPPSAEQMTSNKEEGNV